MLKKQKYIFVIIIILLAIIKQLLVLNLPILAIPYASADDELMVMLAQSLKNGNWLGEYDRNTLVKGIMAPLFIAISNKIGISFISSITLFYTLSCIYFIFCIRKVLKNKYILLITYILLLFNPAMSDYTVLQRVYRNGIIVPSLLIIMGSYIQLFLEEDNKIKISLIYSIIAGFAFSMFYYTREDSVWMMPFMIFILIVSIISFWLKNKKINKDFIKRSVITFIPFIILTLTTVFISFTNYCYYGIYTTNELNDTNFANAIKSLYSVKNDEEIEYVSVTREKVKRIAEVSDAMKTIEPYLNKIMDIYSTFDRKPDDNEVEDGWFFWTLREAVQMAGFYKNGHTADLFYLQLSNEIETALDQGLLQRQKGVMPSPLMPPWREHNGEKLIKTYFETLDFVLGFDDIVTRHDIKSDYNVVDYKKTSAYIEMSKNRINFKEEVYDEEGNSIVDLAEQEEYINSIKYKADVLNGITKIYQKIGYPIGILGIISYLAITICLIIDLIKKKYDLIQGWVITSAIVGSFFCLTLRCFL